MNYFSRIGVRVSIVVALGFLSGTSIAAAKYVDGTMTKIVDGDTVWVEKDSHEDASPNTLKIRMVGIDTPETHMPTANGVMGQQPWGDSAADYLAELLPLKKKVSVQDLGQDKYGRVLGRIFYKDVDVNLEMVESGWAAPYVICEGPGCDESFVEKENVGAYVAACENARAAKRGIFSRNNTLKEMPFEFRMRVTNRLPEKYVGNLDTMEFVAPADYREIDLCKRIFFMTKKAAVAAGFTQARERRLPHPNDFLAFR